MKLLKGCLLLNLLSLILFLVPAPALAYENKIEITGGVFGLSGSNAKTGEKTSVSGLGAYEVSYRRSITKHLDFSAGYSLYFKEILTGDSIYGLNFAVMYFPWSSSGGTESKGENVSYTIAENFRPFVSGAFVQRNFQGIQTTYVGFCAGVGTEYTLSPGVSLITYLHYASLSASVGATAKETVVASGFVFGF